MILDDIFYLIKITEEEQKISNPPFTIKPPEQESFVKKHKKKLMGAAAIGGLVLAAKHGKLPEPLQSTVDNTTGTISKIATSTADAADKTAAGIRQFTGHTKFSDIFKNDETIGGYLRNKTRGLKSLLND